MLPSAAVPFCFCNHDVCFEIDMPAGSAVRGMAAAD
jgi:hypothetical protein